MQFVNLKANWNKRHLKKASYLSDIIIQDKIANILAAINNGHNLNKSEAQHQRTYPEPSTNLNILDRKH
jgi:hypothetical protein